MAAWPFLRGQRSWPALPTSRRQAVPLSLHSRSLLSASVSALAARRSRDGDSSKVPVSLPHCYLTYHTLSDFRIRYGKIDKMDPARNPFAPGAGTQPPELTGRDQVLADVRVTLQRIRERRSDRSKLLVGLRGVGKTVLLNRIDAAAREWGFHSVMLEAPEDKPLADLLVPAVRRILLQLDRAAGAKDKLRSALGALRSFAAVFKVKIGDIGVGIIAPSGVADSGDLGSDIKDLLVLTGEAAVERSSAVALLIDELQYVKAIELGALIAALHRVAQLNLPLVLFGAGLPQLAGLTGQAKSYAERLFVFEDIGALGADDAKGALSEPVRRAGALFTDAALDEIVRATEGYPYFLQEWGKHAWMQAARSPIGIADAKAAGPAAIADLDRSFFLVRLERLTPGEKNYLRAMAEIGPGSHRSGDVAAILRRPVEQVAPIRAKVISKGMVYAPSHGDTAFTVPMFDDFMRRTIPQFTPRPARSEISNK